MTKALDNSLGRPGSHDAPWRLIEMKFDWTDHKARLSGGPIECDQPTRAIKPTDEAVNDTAAEAKSTAYRVPS
jgi:hypothetical protein